ncbi:cold shock domain-containing protein [Peribacillus frigoritolerans]|uniref:cold shock domain-containing protein n=1 Tax=Peribacillus frigoritolerans TaxID=450367 RepID=UPI00387260D2
MNGKIIYYKDNKGFGFIKGEDGVDYFFHNTYLRDKTDLKGLKLDLDVSFNPKKHDNGYRAYNLNILQDYKSEHLKYRLTLGKKSSVNYKGNEEEIKISEKFSKLFGITFSREEQFKNATYYFNFLQPSEKYRESFNMFNEVLMLFSTFNLYDDRAMDYVDKLFMDYSNRLDPVVIVLISKDKNINEIIKRNNSINHESRIIVPFSYDEIIHDSFSEEILQSRLREYFYQRDLYAMESPLKSDSYFFGRTNIVHNFFDKYSIGEQTGLFGLRKTGKTSVLFAIQRLVDTRKGMSVYIDCQNPGVYGLRWYELLEHIIRRIDEDYSLGLKSLTGAFDEKDAPNKFLKSLKEVSQKTSKRVLIILDEIEHITFELSRNEHWKSGEDYLSFWQTIRSIIQTEQNLCSFVVAGVNPKITEQVSINGYDNPIFNNISVTYLSLFTIEDVKSMVGEIGAYMGLKYDESVYHKLHTNYGGHPFLIRNVCSMLNSYFKQRPYNITNRDYDDYKEEIDSKLISYIRSILFVLDSWYPLEFDILKDIALGNKLDYSSKISSNILSINHLLGYGIVTRSAQNNYYIEIDAIKNYMKNNYKNDLIPNEQEEFRELISSRRNSIEKKLRVLSKQVLSIKYGRDKLHNIVTKYTRDTIETILARRDNKDLFEALFFSELKNIIFGEFDAFRNILTLDKAIFIAAMNKINEKRYVDAHAGDITREEYTTLHLYFNQIEEVLENF